MSPLSAFSRPAVLFCLAAGAAGWFGGRWAHQGLTPPAETFRQRPVARPASEVPAAREPQVRADSPAGQWMARVRAGGTADFPALMAELKTAFKQNGDYFAAEAARGWLLSQWITRDAAGAADFVALRTKEDPKDVSLGSQFGLLLGELDPAKAAEILSGPHKGRLGNYFTKALMRALATSWPREFLALDPGDARADWKNHQARALGALAATDPKAAADLWTAGGGETPGLAAITAAWTARNPAEAAAWIESLENPDSRRAARDFRLTALAESDPQAAFTELCRLRREEQAAADTAPAAEPSSTPAGSKPAPGQDNGRRPVDDADARHDETRLAVLSALARRNPDSALEAWKTLDEDGSPQAAKGNGRQDPDQTISRALAAAVKSRFPDEAGALLKSLAALPPADSADSRGRQRATLLARELLAAKAASWSAETRLEAAGLILTGTGGEAETYGLTLSAWFSQAATEVPAARAAAFVKSLPESQRSLNAERMLGGAGPGEAEFVREVTSAVPAADWRPEFGGKLAENPAENADFVTALPDTPKTALARFRFAGDWGRADPAAAGQWVAALPPDAASIQAARGLTDAWGRYDETAASAWAGTLPPGPQRDGAALGLAASVSASEPESAWEWAASIGNPTLRADALFNVASAWGDESPPEFRAAFTEALEQGGYTGAVKTRFLRVLNQPSATRTAAADADAENPTSSTQQ